MKKPITHFLLTLSAAILLNTETQAQQKSIGNKIDESNLKTITKSNLNANKEIIPNKTGKALAGGCDTVNFAKGFVKPYKWSSYTWAHGTGGSKGFSGGINSYNDKEKGNYIDLSTYAAGSKISSVLIWFSRSYSTNMNKTVTVNVYDNSGAASTPGAIPLGSQTITLASIKTDITNKRLTTVAFSTPITIPLTKKVYVTCDVSQLTWTGLTGTDSLAIVASDTLQENPGIAWEKTSTGTWQSFVTGWGLKQMALYIFPCITNDATAPSVTLTTNPSNGIVCAGSPITFDPAGSVAPFGLFWNASSGYSTPIFNGNKVTISYNTPGNYTYKQYAEGCGYEAVKTTNITVKANPAVNALSSTSYCAGTAVPTQLLNSTPSGATFSWSNNNSSIGLAANGTGDVSAFTATNVANTSTISGTVAVTATLNGCTGASTTYTISVKPLPAMGGLSNTSVCSNSSITPTAFTSLPAGATFTWTNSNSSIGLAASGNGSLPTFTANTGNTASTGTVTVTPSLNGCAGNGANFAIIVNPLPTITATSSKDSICNGSSANLGASGIGGTFQWSPVTGLNNAAVANPIASPTSTTNYTVSTTDNNGCSATATINLAVKNCIGISEQQITEISLAYDPSSNTYFLLSSNLMGNALVQIYNNIGQELVNQPVSINNSKIELNTTSLSAGVYYVKYSMNNKVFNSKIKID